VTGRWVSPGTPVSSTNKTDRHDITEILLKVALNTITPDPRRWEQRSHAKVVHQLKIHKKNVFFLFGSIHAKMH